MKNKIIQVYVLIPDKASGDYFSKKLNRLGIGTEYGYYYIHPRVIGNKIAKSEEVTNDMNRIFATFGDQTKSVVIACNTLQLWLDKIDHKYRKNVKIYTTFEACRWKYPDKNDRPLWLGTTPLVKKTRSFPTLLKAGMPALQNAVQELIWRIKMYYGDEIITAFDSVTKDRSLPKKNQFQIIEELKSLIIEGIKKTGSKRVIMGCTELPLVFENEKKSGICWIDPADVLAEYVKHQSVVILFAGGTISGLANKDGAIVGGKMFNLIEKLSEEMPGSFKKLNITKADVMYDGLSENLESRDLDKIWGIVKKAISASPSRIIITHGTDAMEQTARFLEKKINESMVGNQTKVVLTGANLSPDKPKTDAWNNLRWAINLPTPNNCPVMVSFGNTMTPAGEVVKAYINGKNYFVSKKSPRYSRYKNKQAVGTKRIINLLKKSMSVEPAIEKVLGYEVNVIRENHHDFIKTVKDKNILGVVFKLYHSGTANTTGDKASVDILVESLTKNGVVCFGATETGEPVDLHAYETSVKLRKAGMVPLYNMMFDVAHCKLALIVSKYKDLKREDWIQKMLTPVVGEIDRSRIIKSDIEELTKLQRPRF